MELLADDIGLLPNFLSYWLCAIGLLGGFARLYLAWTPYHEVALIRDGNLAAAYSFSGAILGFATALTFVVANSAELHEVLFWGVVAALVQLAGYSLVRFIIPTLPDGITHNNVAHGVFLGAIGLVLGLITGASLVP
ncbi:MAG: DUF350 domain-containing protein [Nitrospiraceae bacterium]